MALGIKVWTRMALLTVMPVTYLRTSALCPGNADACRFGGRSLLSGDCFHSGTLSGYVEWQEEVDT